jgi:hypothetical protein
MLKRLIWILLIAVLLLQAFMLSQANHGDLNHDGHVNIKDLSIMAKHYNK